MNKIEEFLKDVREANIINRVMFEKLNEIAGRYQTSNDQQLTLTDVGWRSEQLPDFDVQEINDILKDCKENKDDLQSLITRTWNKGYMTGVLYDSEND